MTADVELLPLSEWTKRDDLVGLVPPEVRVEMCAYARANVLHHTAAQAAEIEALRAEVERLKSMTAVTMGVGSGDGSLFVHGDYDSIKAAQALVFRSERLAEALREARRVALLCDPLVRARQHLAANSLEAQAFNLVAKIDALLRDQEAGNE